MRVNYFKMIEERRRSPAPFLQKAAHPVFKRFGSDVRKIMQ
jgi:hypothetical protein